MKAWTDMFSRNSIWYRIHEWTMKKEGEGTETDWRVSFLFDVSYSLMKKDTPETVSLLLYNNNNNNNNNNIIIIIIIIIDIIIIMF